MHVHRIFLEVSASDLYVTETRFLKTVGWDVYGISDFLSSVFLCQLFVVNRSESVVQDFFKAVIYHEILYYNSFNFAYRIYLCDS
jgi:hypothetical protein